MKEERELKNLAWIWIALAAISLGLDLRMFDTALIIASIFFTGSVVVRVVKARDAA